MASEPNTPRSRILDDPIGLFIPGCRNDERHLRERLLKAREIASSRVVHLRSANARILTWLLLETVTEHLYAPVTEDELRDAADQCLRLFMCSQFAERLETGR
jgi:hypothetical protein